MEWYEALIAAQWRAESIDPLVEFRLLSAVQMHAKDSRYTMHEVYNVFNALTAPRFIAEHQAFCAKYHNLWAISKTVGAATMIELGVLCGASADAVLHANPDMHYLGIDDFAFHREDVGDERETACDVWGFPWDGETWVRRLLIEARRYAHVTLQKSDLRTLRELPEADFVCVDAAHDFHNQRRDMELAMSASPNYIYIDDFDGTAGEKAATMHFLSKYADRVAAAVPLAHTGGGLLLVMRRGSRGPLLRRQEEERQIELALAGTWEYRRLGHDARRLELCADGRIGEGRAACEYSWRIDLEDDRPLLSIASERMVTCRLAEFSPGVYRGRWLTHERMPVELVHVNSSDSCGSQPAA